MLFKIQIDLQTEESEKSSLIWLCTACLGVSVQKFRIIAREGDS